MDRRQKIGIALLLLGLLLLLLGLVYWFWLRRAPAVTPTTEPTVTTGTQAGLGTIPSANKPPPLTEKPIPTPGTGDTAAGEPTDAAVTLRPLAKTFAERYLTYSSAGDYENLNDAKLMMTPAFASRTDETVAIERAKTQAEDFFGVTSRAISIQLGAYDETTGTAAMVVDLNRQERISGGVLRTPYNQRLTVMFVRLDGTWKVDDAYLEPYKR